MQATKSHLNNYLPLPEGDAQYSISFIESQGAIKLDEDDETAIIGITDRTRDEIKKMLRIFHNKSVIFLDIDPTDLSAYLGSKFGEADIHEATAPSSGIEDHVLLDKLANDAPIINLVNAICIEGIHSGASDIHIETSSSDVKIRYRIDGVLRTVRTVDLPRFPAISTRIKIMANLNILERRQPQDGRIAVSLRNEQVDLRVSIIPTTTGESIVLRILGKRMVYSSLESLGFVYPQLGILRRLIHLPYGLILITGPTGSGKTTTLNGMLHELVSDSLKIVTIEDPVEFSISGISQIQINEQIGLGFNTLLRRVLRQDPNIMMIGEIRDNETAEIAVRSALTGHLVLSTLHTNDAASVIPRLINMNIEPYLLASVLRGASAQRLVRKLCNKCKIPYTPPPREQSILKQAALHTDLLYQPKGCSECGHTGFIGRIVIAEVFASTDDMEDLLLKKTGITGIRNYLSQNGMSTLLKEGLTAAIAGLTTIQEVEREIAIPGGDVW